MKERPETVAMPRKTVKICADLLRSFDKTLRRHGEIKGETHKRLAMFIDEEVEACLRRNRFELPMNGPMPDWPVTRLALEYTALRYGEKDAEQLKFCLEVAMYRQDYEKPRGLRIADYVWDAVVEEVKPYHFEGGK